MLRQAALVLLALFFASPLGAQETVVPGISTDTISLTADYNGSKLFVFGAVRRRGPVPDEANPLDVIVTIKGPAHGVNVLRKERRFGIWVNAEQVKVRQAPSFYAVATTRPLQDILSQTELLRYQIGMDQAVRRVGGSASVADTAPFTAALVRLREKNGSYAQLDDSIKLAEETLFQTTIDMPANLVEGLYSVQFFLVRDHKVVSTGNTAITVQKAGLERWIYNMSRNRPLLYGLMSVALALLAGWLAAAGFALVRRR